MKFIQNYLSEVVEITKNIDLEQIQKIIQILISIRKNRGRVFFLGVGGSAGNCSHAVNDFRKIAGIECYAPTDNVSELTARTNDEGWSTIFSEWLKLSRLNSKDAIFIFSVGGGSIKDNISPNLVEAIKYAKLVDSKILGIIGKKEGYTNSEADACVVVPQVNQNNITPHSEAFQAIIWHLIVSHPEIKLKQTKWESTDIEKGSVS